MKHRRDLRPVRRYVLAIAALLAAAGAITAATTVHRARKQALAVARLQAAGLSAYYDYEMTDMGSPNRSGSVPVPGPGWLKRLFGVDLFHNVTAVCGPSAPDEAAERIADSVLAPVEQLPEVTYVSLTECNHITDAALPHLLSLRKITSLRLDGTGITNAGVAALRALATVRELDLSFTSTTDTAVRAISELPHLESLNLTGTRITDAGLRALRACRNLRCLRVEFCDVTSGGLAQLECLGRLECLWLGSNSFRNADAENLGRLKGLRSISVGVKFTKRGEQRLRQLIPGLKTVERIGPTAGGGMARNVEEEEDEDVGHGDVKGFGHF